VLAGVRKPVVVGNWKMNGLSEEGRALAHAIAQGWQADARLAQVECIVCPSFPYLATIAQAISGEPIALGAQNVSAFAEGAHTGEVSAAMLVDVGCTWAIVGHSERRSGHGDIDQAVADKARAALASGLGVIACVGETLAEREAGQTEQVINRQLQPLLETLGAADPQKVMIAYEPVWAIGTGRTATPEQAGEIHMRIRSMLQSAGLDAWSIRILYGGSVKSANAGALLVVADIDGALVGGASLDAEDFLAIARSAVRP
jgi:triosephosphate isomerase